MKLFLDDFRNPYSTKHVDLPPGPWTISRNFSEFCNVIDSHFKSTGELPTFISFDHDLSIEDSGGYEAVAHYEDYTPISKTGLDCVNWLIRFCTANHLPFPNYVCHSLNKKGKEKIYQAIRQFNLNCPKSGSGSK